MARKCAAYNASRNSTRCWKPCRRPARCGDVFCSRHRRALDGAMLGILQVELRVARARARQARRMGATENGFNGAVAGTVRSGVRKTKTVVCTQCGTIWQKEAYIRQQQNLEADESYRSRPK